MHSKEITPDIRLLKPLSTTGSTLMEPDWIPAMVAQIKRQKFFRWHDAGDIQSAKHLTNIFEVCKQTPSTKHWLPTRESRFLKFIDPDIIPANLIIRLSGHMVDGKNATWWPWTSAVSSKTKTWPAKAQGNQCLDCRACWNREVSNVTYPKHWSMEHGPGTGSLKPQAPWTTSRKHQAPSVEAQASSRKPQAPWSANPHKVSRHTNRGAWLRWNYSLDAIHGRQFGVVRSELNYSL